MATAVQHTEDGRKRIVGKVFVAITLTNSVDSGMANRGALDLANERLNLLPETRPDRYLRI